MSAEDRGFT